MSLKAAQLKLIRLGYGSVLGKTGADGINGKISPQVRKALDNYIGQLGNKGIKNFVMREFVSENKWGYA